MVLRKIRVTNVDMYGFCGREFHPTESDVGKFGFIVATETECMSTDGVCYSTRNQDEIEKIANIMLLVEEDENTNWMVTTYHFCKMKDGTILELLDFEIKHLREEY